MSTDSENSLYDGYYYQTGCGKPYERNEEWLTFFKGIAERIKRDINPSSVLDAGCALGFLVENLRELGIKGYGIDISEFAIRNVHESIREFCWVGSITQPFPEHYDLIVSIEVLEHLPKHEAENAIENICQHTDDIIFSSSPYDFREITHFNVQTPDYWAELFARQGFFRDLDYDATFLTDWAVRFRRSKEPVHRVIRGYERVMQRLVQENTSLRRVNLEQKNELAFKEGQIQTLQHQLTSVMSGLTFRLAQKMRTLIPIGSFREKVVLKLFKRPQ